MDTFKYNYKENNIKHNAHHTLTIFYHWYLDQTKILLKNSDRMVQFATFNTKLRIKIV